MPVLVRVAVPGPTPVARPCSSTLTTAVSLLLQTRSGCPVTSCTAPSSQVACAWNCCSTPTGTLISSGLIRNEARVGPSPVAPSSSSLPHPSSASAANPATNHLPTAITHSSLNHSLAGALGVRRGRLSLRLFEPDGE
ncbi:hypothetical protein D3C84_491880 [compost metagenome]